MKSSVLFIFAIFFIIICIVSFTLINMQIQKNELANWNKTYEYYLNKEIPGTEIATLIGKVTNQNEKNNVKKDKNGYYIDNGKNSIKLDLKMITIEKTYPMEEIYNNEIAKFVQNFNFINFKCTSIEYHKTTGKISKLVFEELQ